MVEAADVLNDWRQKELAALVNKFSNGAGVHPTSVPGLTCMKATDTLLHFPTVYNPSLCIVVQGSKEVILDDEPYRYAPSDYLVVSVDLPLIAQITEAAEDKPYLSLKIEIDQRLLSELLTETGKPVQADSITGRGLFVGKLDGALGDSVLRLARLLETPWDIPVLAPMLTREIYYRLLNSEYGVIISQLAVSGSNMQRIATVIRKLKSEFAKPIRVEEMAKIAGMSVSSFHSHFKAVTAMSPLQYQKRLRLTEARRIMLADTLDATSTAYRVGYESPSQFSREYARMFGNPPLRDIGRLKKGLNGYAESSVNSA